jgi:septum formation protein
MTGAGGGVEPGREGPPLVLASESPRRRRLLEQLGLRFEVVPARIDERVLPDESPPAHARRLALAKARAVAADRADALVVAGDTVVTLHDRILGKPEDRDHAVAMLLRLQGHTHRVETGVAVIGPDGAEAVDVVAAEVRFRTFGRALAEAYADTGEPLDKAGAYGIQGLGAVLVESVDGDYFAVMGLSISRLVTLMGEVGYGYGFEGEVRALPG